MKKLLFLASVCLLVSCSEAKPKQQIDRFIIETIVQLQQGKTNQVLELFKSTNPDLVRGESDWIMASFSAVEGKDMVIVRAEWKSKTSYLKFSNSEKFKKTMAQFGKYFLGKPKVTISKVLFEM